MRGSYFFIAFLERVSGGRGKRERERNRNISVREKHLLASLLYTPQLGIKHATWVCVLTGNGTCDPLVSGTRLHPTEPHQPGLGLLFYTDWFGKVSDKVTVEHRSR